IGRLRLAVTNAPVGQISIVPAFVVDVLPGPGELGSEAQQRTIAAHVMGEKAAHELAKLPPQPTVFAAAKTVTRKDKKLITDEPRAIHVLARGELNKPEEVAHPGALSCIETLRSQFELQNPKDEGARRAAMADWLTDPKNPLTWRSIVNRVWHYHFGRGLVDTPNDLGRMGGLPSHPELLDWLSAELWETRGSLKNLHRLILTSA